MNKKGFIDKILSMVLGVIIILAIALFLIANLWPEISEEITELNATNPAAAGNLTAIQTDIPVELYGLVGILFIAITLMVILAIWRMYKGAEV